MTMPLAAAYLQEVGHEPLQLSDSELGLVIDQIDQDLPGDVLGYLREAIPQCQACECGALHVDIGDRRLTETTRRSLARVFATPFSAVVGEWSRRQYGLNGVVKFGWSNLDRVAPNFAQAVPVGSAQQMVYAHQLEQADMERIVSAIALDTPLAFEFIRASAEQYDGSSFMAQSLTSEEAGGRENWVETIDQLMLIGSTPMRKYVAEWLRRQFGIEKFTPINCCRTSFGGDEDFARHAMKDQISQQLTPDC